MQNSTHDNVRSAVVGHFTLEDIIAAKDTLWDCCKHDVIGDKSRRRDTKERPMSEAHISDIMAALTKLSKNNNMPIFAIDAISLRLIPRSRPEELNTISMVDRLNKIEGAMTTFQEPAAKMDSLQTSIDRIITNLGCLSNSETTDGTHHLNVHAWDSRSG